MYNMHGRRLSQVIPMYYHGDEGRGKLRRAVLVTSYVAGLPKRGHSFLSRYLAAVFPGERYAVGPDGVETLQALHEEVAKDLMDLYLNGFDAGGLEEAVFIHTLLPDVTIENLFSYLQAHGRMCHRSSGQMALCRPCMWQ